MRHSVERPLRPVLNLAHIHVLHFASSLRQVSMLVFDFGL